MLEAAHFDLLPVKGLVILPGRKADDLVIGCEGLDIGLAAFLTAAAAPDHLCQQGEGTLAGTEIVAVQALVRQ